MSVKTAPISYFCGAFRKIILSSQKALYLQHFISCQKYSLLKLFVLVAAFLKIRQIIETQYKQMEQP